MRVASAFALLTVGLFSQSSLDTANLMAQMPDTDCPAQIKYFSLQHLAPDKMDDGDRELVRKRQKDLIAEAQFYGYDLIAGNWTYDQSVCLYCPPRCYCATSRNFQKCFTEMRLPMFLR